MEGRGTARQLRWPFRHLGPFPFLPLRPPFLLQPALWVCPREVAGTRERKCKDHGRAPMGEGVRAGARAVRAGRAGADLRGNALWRRGYAWAE